MSWSARRVYVSWFVNFPWNTHDCGSSIRFHPADNMCDAYATKRWNSILTRRIDPCENWTKTTKHFSHITIYHLIWFYFVIFSALSCHFASSIDNSEISAAAVQCLRYSIRWRRITYWSLKDILDDDDVIHTHHYPCSCWEHIKLICRRSLWRHSYVFGHHFASFAGNIVSKSISF